MQRDQAAIQPVNVNIFQTVTFKAPQPEAVVVGLKFSRTGSPSPRYRPGHGVPVACKTGYLTRRYYMCQL